MIPFVKVYGTVGKRVDLLGPWKREYLFMKIQPTSGQKERVEKVYEEIFRSIFWVCSMLQTKQFACKISNNLFKSLFPFLLSPSVGSFSLLFWAFSRFETFLRAEHNAFRFCLDLHIHFDIFEIFIGFSLCSEEGKFSKFHRAYVKKIKVEEMKRARWKNHEKSSIDFLFSLFILLLRALSVI